MYCLCQPLSNNRTAPVSTGPTDLMAAHKTDQWVPSACNPAGGIAEQHFVRWLTWRTYSAVLGSKKFVFWPWWKEGCFLSFPAVIWLWDLVLVCLNSASGWCGIKSEKAESYFRPKSPNLIKITQCQKTRCSVYGRHCLTASTNAKVPVPGNLLVHSPHKAWWQDHSQVLASICTFSITVPVLSHSNTYPQFAVWHVSLYRANAGFS